MDSIRTNLWLPKKKRGHDLQLLAARTARAGVKQQLGFLWIVEDFVGTRTLS